MRRSRYTITYSPDDSNEIRRMVVLAYSIEGAQRMRIANAVVLDVQRGDYRKQEREAKIKAEGGFRIDRQALADAIDLLGLKLPVKIRFNSRVGRQNGNYRLRNGHHDIMLKSYRTPQQASDTLWHELTHALQAERDGHGSVSVWADVRRAQASIPYLSKPLEVEARQMSATMRDCPLCVEA